MKHYLTFQDDTSDKFWQIETSESSFTVTYGRTGTSGQSQTKTFDSEAVCLKEAEKILAEKRKKGYAEDGVESIVVAAKPRAKSEKSKKVDNLAEVLAEYDKLIVEKAIDGLLPFLQSVEKRHYEAFKKHIRKAKKYWMTYVELVPKDPNKKNDWGTWGYRGDEIQKKIIVLSAMALFDKTEINSLDEAYQHFNNIEKETITIDKENPAESLAQRLGIKLLGKKKETQIFEVQYIKDILLWSKPSWIVEFMEKRIPANLWVGIWYYNLRKLEDLKLIEFSPRLYAYSLATYSHYQVKNGTDDYINRICDDELAIKRDIPQLFNYETAIQYRADDWETIFNKLLTENKIDRNCFLESCLQVQTKEWNNSVRSFYRKRFDDTKPTKDELVTLQSSLFPLLHASLNQVANYAVGYIKDIYEEENFEMDNFLDWIQPVMMREDCKGSLKTILTMFEKICKNRPEFQAKILDLSVDIFAVNDLTLQEKVGKILQKYAQKDQDELVEKLSMYAPQMLGNVKSLISDLLTEDTDNEEIDLDIEYNFTSKPTLRLRDKNLVELPKDWNELLFQIGNFVSSGNVIDLEVLMNSLILLQDKIPADYQKQTEPYQKKLYGTYYESSYKNFTKEYLLHWMNNVSKKFDKVQHYGYNSKVLDLQYNRLVHLDNKVKEKSTLPLLSFPTHKPYWVEPKTLIERLIAYRSADEKIDMTDLAIAIARMPRERVDEALPLCEQLDANLSKLMKFCLGVNEKIELDSEGNFFTKFLLGNGQTTKESVHNSLWALAARTYYPNKIFPEFEKTFLADVPNVVAPFTPEPYFKEDWSEWTNYQTKEKERSKSWFFLNVDFPPHKNIPPTLLYSLDFFDKGKQSYYYGLSGNDVYYWYGLTPQNLDSLYILILQTAGRMSGGNFENNASGEYYFQP
jgi:predicted DNA-binding WGR domain protein